MPLCNIVNLSTIQYTGSVSPPFMTAALIMHIMELIFLMTSWFLVTYIVILFKRIILRLFHINICFFLFVFFIIYYFHFMFRSTLFIICYADTAIDISPSGPFKWLHVGREFCLFVGGNMFPLMYIERFYASRDLLRYEKVGNIFISFSLIITCVIIVVIFEIARFYGAVEVVVMPFVILASNLMSAIGMYFIIRQNNQFLKIYYSFQLSVKVQLRGNIRTCSPIFPNLVMASVSATVGALLYGFAFYAKGQVGLLLSLLFDLGISIYLCVAPIVMFICVKELRKFAFLCFFKSVSSATQNEQNTYFQQLKMQWS